MFFRGIERDRWKEKGSYVFTKTRFSDVSKILDAAVFIMSVLLNKRLCI